MNRSLWVVVCIVALFGAACSDDGGGTDGPVAGDGPHVADGGIDGKLPPSEGGPPKDVTVTDSGGWACNDSTDCDDKTTCTDDACTNGVCTHTIYTAFCLINGACVKDGAKNGPECQVCDPQKSQTAWTAIVGGCTISNLCWEKGEKDPSGCLLCDPSKSATDWTPAASYDCKIGNQCFIKGETDDTGCNVCDPTKSSTDWTTAAADCTIDGLCYKTGDKHPSFTCQNVVCDPTTTSSAWTVKGNECLIGDLCYPANTKSPDGCQQCIPSQAKTKWSSGSFDCQLDGKCYVNGDAHPSPTCTSVVCDNTQSNLSWTIKGNECLINGVCRQPGDRTAQGCMVCDPTTSKLDWSPASYDCKIGAACYTDGDKHPDPACTSVVCDKATSSTAWTVTGNECFINGACYQAGATTSQGCLECNPAKDKNDWSTATSQCQINGACYKDGDKHPSPSCTNVVCDSAANSTAWTVKGTECLIGDVCFPSGATHPVVTCTMATCDPASSKTSWTVTGNGCLIADACYQPGALHPTGCWSCDPTVSKTKWTAAASCSKIILAALNEPHPGDLGGISGANALCAAQAQAAGVPGTWKAFLSSSTQNVKDLITGTNATTIPVVNLQGGQMYSYWDYIFITSLWSSAGYYMYTFAGTTVNSSFCSDGDGWTGSLSSGSVATSYTCNDWTTSVSPNYGRNGELDERYLLKQETALCSASLAVVCVQIP